MEHPSLIQRTFCYARHVCCILLVLAAVSCSNPAGKAIRPATSDAILNNFNFNEIGLKKGDHLPDVELWTKGGQSKISTGLTRDKNATVFITGSYTCDVTRSQLSTIDSMSELFKDHFNFYLINTVEAHPVNSASPYSVEPQPWLAEENLKAGIEADQPQTMRDRMELADKWVEEQQIQTPVLLDGPDNQFWTEAGQAPNMVLVVSPEGEVLHKQPWFNAEDLGDFLDKP